MAGTKREDGRMPAGEKGAMRTIETMMSDKFNDIVSSAHKER